MLKGVGDLAYPLPYHFPKGKDHYHVSLSGQSALSMLGITLTSSENKEASSTGLSSGQRQLLVAQEGTLSYLSSLTFGTQHTISGMFRLKFRTYL